MMRNGEGYPSPTEHEAIRNIEEEKNKYVEEVFDNIEKMLSLIGYELVGICIKDRRSRKKYSRKGGRYGHQGRK